MFIEKVKDNIIVSCQALENEPLHSSYIMSKMALAAYQAGAAGIRANSKDDIVAIQNEVPLPIIGIVKKDYSDSDVYITPTLKDVRSLCVLKVEVIAMDATFNTRPNNESLEEIVRKVKEEFPNILLMADIATLEEAKNAERIGFDIVGTTLHGYTTETKDMNIADNDFEFLKDVLKIIKIPVIAEGKIDTPEKAKRVLELGAHSVVVGGAITRPQEIAKKFTDKVKELQNHGK